MGKGDLFPADEGVTPAAMHGPDGDVEIDPHAIDAPFPRFGGFHDREDAAPWAIFKGHDPTRSFHDILQKDTAICAENPGWRPLP
jgi:hypothetical protein